MVNSGDTKTPPITIKKYANRRLYNTATSSYVTLDHLSQMVKDGVEFSVFDAKSGEDITRQVLTHIIVEEESKGQNLLPINFLRHLISFYGDNLQAVVPQYLDYSMQSFAHNQEQMRHYLGDALGDTSADNPFVQQFEEMGKQNMAMFEKAMKTFSPLGSHLGSMSDSGAKSDPPPSSPGSNDGGQQLDELRTKLEQMQRQLDNISPSKD